MRTRSKVAAVLTAAATAGMYLQTVASGQVGPGHHDVAEADHSTPWPYGDPVADGTVTRGAGTERREPRQSAPANSADFSKAGGNLANQNYSELTQITPKNIGRLGGAWHLDVDPAGAGGNQQSSAIVSDGVMYV